MKWLLLLLPLYVVHHPTYNLRAWEPVNGPYELPPPVSLDPPPFTLAMVPPIWRCLAWYESRDNPQAVNPTTGDSGIWQDNLGTWDAYKPPGYPSSPLDASLRQQFIVNIQIQEHQGWQAWSTFPYCRGFVDGAG